MDASLIQILFATLGTIIVAAITSLVSLQAVRVQERRQRKQADTDNAEKVSNMAVNLLKPYEGQLAKMQARLDRQDKLIAELRQIQAMHEQQIKNLEMERDSLRDWAERLVCQVTEAGLIPEKYIEPKTRPIKRGDQ